jgi:hypothetical protein
MVVFEPDGGGEAKTGQIVPAGTFTLYSIKPGSYRVAVRTSMFAAMGGNAPKVAGKPITIGQVQGRFKAVPARYENAKSSGLCVEVKQGETISLELRGK